MKENQVICFVIHRGYNDYLKTCIDHAEKFNPDINIVLIGDNESKKACSEKTQFELISNYAYSYEQLERSYIHLSPNDPEYEKFCLERWFIIKAYMQKNDIDHAMYIDSDVLLNNITDEVSDPNNTYYYCHDSGHTSSFSRNTMEMFCNYIEAQYDHEISRKKLQDLYKWRIEGNYLGGISDMTMVLKYANVCEKKCNLASIRNMSFYDHNINEADYMEKYFNYKAIYFVNGHYYFRQTMTGDFILANSIHFQGDAKEIMNFIDTPPMDSSEDEIYVFDPKLLRWINPSQMKTYSKNKTIIRKIINKGLTILGWNDMLIPYKI